MQNSPKVSRSPKPPRRPVQRVMSGPTAGVPMIPIPSLDIGNGMIPPTAPKSSMNMSPVIKGTSKPPAPPQLRPRLDSGGLISQSARALAEQKEQSNKEKKGKKSRHRKKKSSDVEEGFGGFERGKSANIPLSTGYPLTKSSHRKTQSGEGQFDFGSLTNYYGSTGTSGGSDRMNGATPERKTYPRVIARNDSDSSLERKAFPGHTRSASSQSSSSSKGSRRIYGAQKSLETIMSVREMEDSFTGSESERESPRRKGSNNPRSKKKGGGHYRQKSPVEPGLDRNLFSMYARGDVSFASDIRASIRASQRVPQQASLPYLQKMKNRMQLIGNWWSRNIPTPTHLRDLTISLLKSILFDPEDPEFTYIQRFTWAVLIGIFFGVATAYWGFIIESCVELMWVHVPYTLKEVGLFTEVDGAFPLAHYCWICPAIFGGILALLSHLAHVPIPGQNEWIEGLHKIGVMQYDAFFYVFFISTGGMASGMSLGPELPLVLLAGMIGSWLAIATKQSILSARTLNLTCGSAAVAGFFGFPMAGALFVLEIPHRNGLQYYEALSPATIASILSVLTNRIVTSNDVKGYFDYPFLNNTLPSHFFYIAVLYGIVGAILGTIYCKTCLKLKMNVHHLFEPHNDDKYGHSSNHGDQKNSAAEKLPLVGKPSHINVQKRSIFDRIANYSISNEYLRSYIVGSISGLLAGLIGMFVPATIFWGEAQLQHLINRGKSKLPFITEEGVEELTHFGYCMVHDGEELTTKCYALISFTKILAIGISLGSGIVGGHFWGPLFVGASFSYVFTDIMRLLSSRYNNIATFGILGQFPCVALLCIMGSSHVVTYRAHTAIMLILTLTISNFGEGGGDGGGDYSAIFPLLVVSVFVSLMITPSVIFYGKQRARGDLIAAPQNLCEPLKTGEIVVPHYGVGDFSIDSEDEEDDDEEDDWGALSPGDDEPTTNVERIGGKGGGQVLGNPLLSGAPKLPINSPATPDHLADATDDFLQSFVGGTLPPRGAGIPPPGHRKGASVTLGSMESRHRRVKSYGGRGDISVREGYTFGDAVIVDASRSRTNSSVNNKLPGHRRDGSMTSNSGMNVSLRQRAMSRESFSKEEHARPATPTYVKLSSFGEVEFQPDLLDQARFAAATRHTNSHSRKASASSASRVRVDNGVSAEDIEREFQRMNPM